MDRSIDGNLYDASVERSRRIRLAVAAYAYEFENVSIISDSDFDALAKKINPEQTTIDEHTRVYPNLVERYTVLDNFFKTEFSPDTGQWIHKHPELDRVARIYERFWKR